MLGLNQALGSKTDLLLPEQTNLSDWITQPTTDGKTLVNVKGTNTTLTSINCIDFENADADEVVSDASIAPTGDWYVECFYYPDSHINFAEVILTNSSDQYIGTNSTTGQLRARIGATAYATSASNTIPTGEWSRIVSQRSGSNVTFTVYEANGTQRWTETLSASSTALTAGTLKLGGIFSGRTIDGKLAHVKVGNSSTDIIAHYPLAEGSGTKVYDISGQGNHATSASVSYTGLSGITSYNHQYGFTGNSLLKVPVLENKTKQLSNFDGTVYIQSITDSATKNFFGAATITTTLNIVNTSSTEIINSLGGASYRLYIAGGNWHINTTDTSVSVSAGKQTVEVTFNSDGHGTQLKINDSSVYTGTTSDYTLSASGGLQIGARAGGLQFTGKMHSWKLVNDSGTYVEYDFQNNIGTSTIKDISGNSRDGTLQSPTLSDFWKGREVDSNGSIVPACYASGATEITNPSGYVHNGSECSFDLVTSDLTTANRNVIVNSTATRDFLKRDNSKQGYTPNGSSESVFFDHTLNSSSDWQAESEFIVGETTSTQQAVFSATGTTNNDYGFMLRYEDSATRWRLRIADGTSFYITKPTLELGDVYKVTLSYFSSTNKCTLVVEKNGIAETFVDNQSISNTPDFNGEAALGRLRWSGSFGGYTYKSMKFTQGTTTNVELDIANSAGLSTIADLSGNGHNGTLKNTMEDPISAANLANTWASGNLAKQLLQYTGNLSDAGELARTRAYVS